MNVLVYDVAANESGALSVLNHFYEYAKNYEDLSVRWYFAVSLPELEETEQITVLRFPWVKKSWFHRLWFDHRYARRLIREYQIDEVISLQNIAVPHYKKPQILYVHTSLPFVDYRFGFRESKISWIYQNILGRSIESSIRKAKTVIVQTEWMKKRCAGQAKVAEEKFLVRLPAVEERLLCPYQDSKEARRTFFYPANPYEYKNQEVIVKACRRLKEKGIMDYQVIFTFTGTESSYAKRLKTMIEEEKLPVRLAGHWKKEEVFACYGRSILLFPSYVETVGLPLMEARASGCYIIAAKEAHSLEMLKGYEKARLFDKFDDRRLSEYMEEFIMQER